ncbi:NADPH-dependent F420 reductase [Nocardia heshunensis]
MVTFGIVGAGSMGRAIATRLATAGHPVLLGDRHPERARQVAAEIAADLPAPVRATEVAGVVGADIVVVALWYPGTIDFARQYADDLRGKIVVDIANPLDETYTGLTLPPTTSAAEQLAGALPASLIVKAFNTVPAQVLIDGVLDDLPMDTFVAADDAATKAYVLDLLEGTGLRGIDAGVLANARLLERLTAFGIELGQRHGLGFGFGFKYLPTKF